MVVVKSTYRYDYLRFDIDWHGMPGYKQLMTNHIKAGLLLLFVTFGASCADAVMDMPTELPMCDVQPLASTYIVDCGDGTSVCRDAQGDVMYSDCRLQTGPTIETCVASCVKP